MKTLNESEITKAYKGKPFIPEKLRKIAMGSGNTRAVVYSRRITQSQGALIGITDEIYYKWWDDGIYFTVYIDLKEPDNVIEDCGIQMIKDGSPDFIEIDPTEQELLIFQNIMTFITENKE
jgi:hypothetical protein